MLFLKRLFERLGRMSAPAYYITAGSFILASCYLASALGVLLAQGSFTAKTCEYYLLARYLYTAPQSFLLVAVLAAAVIEDWKARS